MVRESEVLQALMSFRQIVGAAKSHFELVQAECGLSGAQLWMLWEVNAKPGQKVGELAGYLAIHQSTASNLLRQLEKKGMLIRERKGMDQRVVRIFPTAFGIEKLRKAPGPARGVLPDAIDQLSDTARQKLNHALRLLLDHIHRQGKAASKRPLSDLIK